MVRQADGTTFSHEYSIKDHLGNTRVTYSDANNDGVITVADIKQINHYYPFGMNMEGSWNGAAGSNKYQYNGKEWNDDFGLGLNDYGARFYDPAIGRWGAVDPLAEKYMRWTPYNYAMNRPTNVIDPNGMAATEIEGGYRFTGQNAIDAFNYLKMRVGSSNKKKDGDSNSDDQNGDPDAEYKAAAKKYDSNESGMYMLFHYDFDSKRERSTESMVNDILDAIKRDGGILPGCYINIELSRDFERVFAIPAEVQVEKDRWLSYINANNSKDSEKLVKFLAKETQNAMYLAPNLDLPSINNAVKSYFTILNILRKNGIPDQKKW